MTTTFAEPGELRSGNPTLSDQFVTEQLVSRADVRAMTVAGVSIKTLVFLAVVIGSGAWGWASATETVPPELGAGYADTTVTIPGGFWLASFAALFLGIVIAGSPQRAAVLGFGYAICQGFCLGAISAAFDDQTDGIVSATVLSTLCVFAVALLLYVSGIIRPTRKLACAVVAGIGGLSLLYLFTFVCRSSTGTGCTARASGRSGSWSP